MNILYLILILIAIIVYIALFHVDAGYGKFFNPRWGPSIGNRAGWILMEAPAFIVMLIIYLASPARQMDSVAPLVFLLLFELHYFHRTFVFPFLLRGNNSMPLSVILMGACFNGGNAVLQGYCLFGTFAPLPFEPRPDSWLHSIPFLSGLALFLFGMAINHHSDNVIRHLRAPGDTRHYLPDKGLYHYVTSANYLGEIVEWCGFALLTWSPSGLLFAVWTAANLAPRAARIYTHYQQEFPLQMADHPRKRLFPFIW